MPNDPKDFLIAAELRVRSKTVRESIRYHAASGDLESLAFALAAQQDIFDAEQAEWEKNAAKYSKPHSIGEIV